MFAWLDELMKYNEYKSEIKKFSVELYIMCSVVLYTVHYRVI